MPIPKPRKGEKEADYIGRCISSLTKTDPERKPEEIKAMCFDSWRDSKKTKSEANGGDNMESVMLRTDVAKGIKEGKSGVDRKNGIIHGFAVMTKGEVKTHGIEADDITLEGLVALAKKSKMGLKSRFGHPNMSNTALGTFLGRVKNVWKDGNVDRGDLHIDKSAYSTPNGNLADYVLSLAESDPDAFGSSIVAKLSPEQRVNKDGTPKKDHAGKELLPLARVESVHGVDIVDDPAANESMFGEQFFSDGVKPSAEMTKFLDGFLSQPNSVEKVMGFLARYAINTEEDEGELGRGEGKGVGGSPQGDGGAKYCVCPKCDYSEEHKREGEGKSTPCSERKCPKCGAMMKGSDTKPEKETESEAKGDSLSDGELEARVVNFCQVYLNKGGEKMGTAVIEKEKEVKDIEKKVEEKVVDEKSTQELAELKQTNADLAKKVEAGASEVSKMKEDKRVEGIESFIASQKQLGKVLPVFEGKLRSLLIASSNEVLTLKVRNEEGVDEEVKTSASTLLREMVESLPQLVKFEEIGEGGEVESDSDDDRLAKRADELVKVAAEAGKELSFGDALSKAAEEQSKK